MVDEIISNSFSCRTVTIRKISGLSAMLIIMSTVICENTGDTLAFVHECTCATPLPTTVRCETECQSPQTLHQTG